MNSDDKCFCGLDLSLSSTGFCRKQGTSIVIETVKTTPRTCENDLARYRHIVVEMMKRIPQGVTMVCIEDYFTPANRGQIGSALKLVALGTLMRMALYDAGYPFYVIAPGQLKKHIAGKGNVQKSMIIKEVYKRYGVECRDDNQADGYVLAIIAEQIVNGCEGCPKFQFETVAKIIKERPSYNIDK